ncbi:MAG: hypothetical protein QOD92_2753 [Acidimicrobiaceae bacterium]
MSAGRIDGYPLDLRTRQSSPVVGVEHEYRVLDGDEQVDFSKLLHSLGVEGLRLDPTDPNAYRCPWGGVVTADGREAEVATAPVALAPGCTDELNWRLAIARRALADALPASFRLDGYSTHINIEIDDHDVVAAGRLFVKRFAPGMMLLLDRSTSPGLLVRPRYRRLELCGEFCTGDQLRAAVIFAAAGGLACASAARTRSARQELPRRVRSRIRPSNVRAGWYVDRTAFGSDLYGSGRESKLRSGIDKSFTAQAHLREAWTSARLFVEAVLTEDELRLVDRVVDGRLALPLEAAPTTDDVVGPYERGAFERVGGTCRRDGYTMEPIAIAWDAIAFHLHGARDAIVCVPRTALAEFFDQLDRGLLDREINRFLASPAGGRVLRAADQTNEPGLFDELASRGAIVPPERVPGRPLLGGLGGGTPADSRRNKGRRRGPRNPRHVFVGAVAVATIGIGTAIAIAASGNDSSGNVAVGQAPTTVASGPTTSSPPVPAGSVNATQINGFWSGDWGDLVLRVTADGKVVAAYAYDQGMIVGTLTGRRIDGWWCEVPSRKGPGDAGPVQFDFVGDPAKSLTIDGRWQYASGNGTWSEDWDIDAKSTQAPPPELVARLDKVAAECIPE